MEAQTKRTPPFEVENLDGMSPEELRAYANSLSELAKAHSSASTTREYALRKADAMEDRMLGRIQQALDTEGSCDRLYGRLPEWAKW